MKFSTGSCLELFLQYFNRTHLMFLKGQNLPKREYLLKPTKASRHDMCSKITYRSLQFSYQHMEKLQNLLAASMHPQLVFMVVEDACCQVPKN